MGDQGFTLDLGRGVQLAGVDGVLQAPQVHFGQLQGVRVVEAALGHAHVQRHLAAFEAQQADAGPRLLTLDAAARGLALAGAGAAAHAHALLVRAFVVADFVQFHMPDPFGC